MLRELGARVSQSDEVARAMMQPGQAVFREIAAHFGPDVVTPTGTLDRAALARLAFTEGRIEELNAIVHPAVIAAQGEWLRSVAEQEPTAVAVVESALIFETRHAVAEAESPIAAPWRTRFDRIVVVAAPVALRRRRYIDRVLGTSASADGVSLGDDFDRRSASQWSDGDKAALADIVLTNDGSLEELLGKVRQLYLALQGESEDRSAEAM